MSRWISRSLFAALLALLAMPCFAGEAKRACLDRVPPSYPPMARNMHVEGTIVLLVTVAPDGHVTGTKVQSGHPMLAPAAQDAVMHWKFAPGSEADDVTVAVNFKL